jgi:hypothetical protein
VCRKIKKREIVSYATHITIILICVRENCAVNFLTYRNNQINYMNECLNMSDGVENFINTKKPTIILLPENKYRLNKKLRKGEKFWKVSEKKIENKEA